MTHSDPDVLAMMAMSEPGLPAADVRHVESCDECRSELRSLRRVAELARSGPPDESFASPSPAVWARIAEEVGISPAPASDSVMPGAAPRPSRTRAGRRGPASRNSAAGRTRPSRSRAGRISAGLAAVVVVAAAVTITVVLQRDRPVVLGEASLAPLADGSGLTGTAVVQEGPQGVRDIVVAVDGTDALASGDSYREVWLLSSDSLRLVSLGVLDGAGGSFVLPDSIDLADFPVVDVSVEPLDGDPAHSGVSIARGTIDALAG